MGATRANDFPAEANGYGQAADNHARSRTDPDSDERRTGIYGTEVIERRLGAGREVLVELVPVLQATLDGGSDVLRHLQGDHRWYTRPGKPTCIIGVIYWRNGTPVPEEQADAD